MVIQAVEDLCPRIRPRGDPCSAAVRSGRRTWWSSVAPTGCQLGPGGGPGGQITPSITCRREPRGGCDAFPPPGAP